MRQLERRRGHDWRTVVGYLLVAIFGVPLIVGILGSFVMALWNAFH